MTNFRQACALIGVLIAVVLLVVTDQQAPAVRPLDTEESQVSGLRAMEHLRVIAAEPHAVTQFSHARVRDHIVGVLLDLGWDAHVQAGTIDGRPTVYNVVGRLAGTGSTGAIMIAGHYDSVPRAPGAADDGLASASMLEVARALSVGPTMRNDVILTFTDGEEAGLLGARLFIREHMWRDDVGLVLNFEGGGPRGPLVMIEAAKADADLIRTYAKVAPSPVSTSLMPAVIEAAKEGGIGSSDFVPFAELDEPGLNFSNGVDTGFRHTPGDVIERIDVDTLQHQSGTMFALARAYGDRDLDEVGVTEGDVVWVGLLTWLMPVWSMTVAVSMLFVAVLLWIGLIVGGVRQGRLRLGGVMRNVGTALAAPIVSAIVVSIGVGLMTLVRPSYREHFAGFLPRETLPGAGLPGSELYWWGFVLLGAVTTVALFRRARRRATALDAMVGTLAVFLFLAVLTTFSLPGMSYLFTLPALMTGLSGALWVHWLGTSRDDVRATVVLGLSAVAVLVVGVGLIASFQLVTVANAAIIAPFVALFTSQLTSVGEVLARVDRRAPILVLAGPAALLLLLGLIIVDASDATARDAPPAAMVTQVLDATTLEPLSSSEFLVESIALSDGGPCLRAVGADSTAHWCPLPSVVSVGVDLQQVRSSGGEVLLFGGVAMETSRLVITVDGVTHELAPIDVAGLRGRAFSLVLPEGALRVTGVTALDGNDKAVGSWSPFDVLPEPWRR